MTGDARAAVRAERLKKRIGLCDRDAMRLLGREIAARIGEGPELRQNLRDRLLAMVEVWKFAHRLRMSDGTGLPSGLRTVRPARGNDRHTRYGRTNRTDCNLKHHGSNARLSTFRRFLACPHLGPDKCKVRRADPTITELRARACHFCTTIRQIE